MGNTANNKPRRGSIDDDFGHNSFDILKKKNPGQSDSEGYSQADKKSLDTLAMQLMESKLNDPGNGFLFMNPSNQENYEANSTPQTIPTVFKWDAGGNSVYISGTFNQWKSKFPMVKSENNFYTIIDLPLGNHQFKYIVDGQWRINKNVPTVNCSNGLMNNTIEVKSSDFDVLEALTYMESMQAGGNTTPPGEYNQKIPTNPTDAISMMPSFIKSNNKDKEEPSNETSIMKMEDNNVKPLSSDFKKLLTPPALPPQLLQVILNKDTNIQCDPNLLPQPNHVMLNHMYALSIKDGVIVLSAITRYRQKFVSTVLYKPI